MNRMRTLIPLAALLGAFAVQAEETERSYFRVEVIVFTHADGAPDAWPLETLASPLAATDPLLARFAQSRAEQRLDEQADSPADSGRRDTLAILDAIAQLESGQATLTELLLRPEPWVAVDQLSTTMQDALERLESSPEHDVLASVGWYQPLSTEQDRRVRIHDLRPLAASWIGLTPTGALRRDGRPVDSATMLLPDFHFRLDGFVRLRQRQFLHAELALDWRERSGIGPLPDADEMPGTAFEVHRLEQSRTVRPERLEYFDSSWLGLLLRITPWELEGESDAAEAQDGQASGQP